MTEERRELKKVGRSLVFWSASVGCDVSCQRRCLSRVYSTFQILVGATTSSFVITTRVVVHTKRRDFRGLQSTIAQD